MTDFPSFPEQDGKRIVYVREVKTADLPEEVRARTGGLDHLYAIHGEGGEVLGGVAAGTKPEEGVVHLAQTLDDYAAHFDHPGWKGLETGH